MKRTYATLAAAALLGISGALVPAATVHADGPGPGTADYNLSANTSVTSGQKFFEAAQGNSAATAKSTAQFTVEGGTLQLIAVPDLNFGQIPLTTIVSSGDKALENNLVSSADTDATSKNVTAFDGNSSSKLIVNDLRGITGGWTLSTTLGTQFTSKTAGAPALTGITLSLAATGTNQVNGTVSLEGNGIGASPVDVATATGADQGKGSTTWDVNTAANASLKFPGQSAYIPASAIYQSDITWTLTAGA
ncbi:hypothetical protein FMM01_11065 [Schleiferilactobacillus harbinensis]|uniref:WxL domain-containing protein n=1 Tax=Schleiferilactobacillus harbinensis TaxID=304207 RepID=UPI00123A85B0|nr:WxL domain-containing protein [Schleiferilactobacillus harbinensis]QEU47799.1 hypothetical protein FMM01_11065 [Schleiferilactobacillus harbinensis]